MVLVVRGKAPLLVSDISLWEVATLAELKRIRLSMGVSLWLQRATAAPLVERMGITPEIAAEVAALPASFHRDPADRLLVATAGALGMTLVTEDAPFSTLLSARPCRPRDGRAKGGASAPLNKSRRSTHCRHSCN